MIFDGRTAVGSATVAGAGSAAPAGASGASPRPGPAPVLGRVTADSPFAVLLASVAAPARLAPGHALSRGAAAQTGQVRAAATPAAPVLPVLPGTESGATPAPRPVLDLSFGTPAPALEAGARLAAPAATAERGEEQPGTTSDDSPDAPRVIESHPRPAAPPFPAQAGQGDLLDAQASTAAAAPGLAAPADGRGQAKPDRSDRAAPAHAATTRDGFAGRSGWDAGSSSGATSTLAPTASATPKATTTSTARPTRTATSNAAPTATTGATPASTRTPTWTASPNPTRTATRTPTATQDAAQAPTSAPLAEPAPPAWRASERHAAEPEQSDRPSAPTAEQAAVASGVPAPQAAQAAQAARAAGAARRADPGDASRPGPQGRASGESRAAVRPTPPHQVAPVSAERIVTRHLATGARLDQAARVGRLGDEQAAPARAEPRTARLPDPSAQPVPTQASAPPAPEATAPRPAAPTGPAAPALPPEPPQTSLSGAILAGGAHLRLQSETLGDLSLHLRVREGVAHLRVEGEQASQLAGRAPELQRALAAEGLALGTRELERPPAPTAPPSQAARTGADATGGQHREAPGQQGQPDGAPVPGRPAPPPAGRPAAGRTTAHHVEA